MNIKKSAEAGAYNLKAAEIEPTFDQVLIRLIPPGKTPEGIILLDACGAPLGLVLKTGPGTPKEIGYREPCVIAGDVILLTSRAVDLENGLFLVRDRDITCKINRKSLN